MNYVLFVYAVIGIATGSGSSTVTAQEWKPLAVFTGTTYNKELCEQAAKSLNILNRYRCVPVGMGGTA